LRKREVIIYWGRNGKVIRKIHTHFVFITSIKRKQPFLLFSPPPQFSFYFNKFMASTSKYVPPVEFVEPTVTVPIVYITHATEPMEPVPVTWAQIKQLGYVRNFVEGGRIPLNMRDEKGQLILDYHVEIPYVDVNSLRDILRLTAATVTFMSGELAMTEARKNLGKHVEEIKKAAEAISKLQQEEDTLLDESRKQVIAASAGEYKYNLPLPFKFQLEYAHNRLIEARTKYDDLIHTRPALDLAFQTAETSRNATLDAVKAITAPYIYGASPHSVPVAADLVYIINLTDAANYLRLCEHHDSCPVVEPAPFVCSTCGHVNLIEFLKMCIMQCAPNEILIATDQPLPPPPPPVVPVTAPPQPTPAPAPQSHTRTPPPTEEEEAESEASTSSEEEEAEEEAEEEEEEDESSGSDT
jgi:hypothetical protein